MKKDLFRTVNYFLTEAEKHAVPELRLENMIKARDELDAMITTYMDSLNRTGTICGVDDGEDVKVE